MGGCARVEGAQSVGGCARVEGAQSWGGFYPSAAGVNEPLPAFPQGSGFLAPAYCGAGAGGRHRGLRSPATATGLLGDGGALVGSPPDQPRKRNGRVSF